MRNVREKVFARGNGLAVHRSVIKRARQNENARQRNRSWKSRIRTQQKRLEHALTGDRKEEAAALYEGYCSIIDKAASRKVLHRNTASRKKTRMHRQILSWETGKGGPAPAVRKKPATTARKTSQKAKSSKEEKDSPAKKSAQKDKTAAGEKSASKPKAPVKAKAEGSAASKKESAKSKETPTGDSSS